MALFNQRVGERSSPTSSLEALQEITAICNDIALSQPALEALFELPNLASQFNQVNSAPSIAMLEFVTQQKYQTLGMESFVISSEGIVDTVKGWFTKTWGFLTGKIEKVQDVFKKASYRNRIEGIRVYMNDVEREINQPGWQVNLVAYRKIHPMLEHFITSAPERTAVYMSYLNLHRELGKQISAMKDPNETGLHDMFKIYTAYLNTAIDNIGQDIRLAELIYKYLRRLGKPQRPDTVGELDKINTLLEDAYDLRFADSKVNHSEFRDVMANVVRVGNDTENKLTQSIVSAGLKQIDIQYEKDDKFKKMMSEIEDKVAKMSTSVMMLRS